MKIPVLRLLSKPSVGLSFFFISTISVAINLWMLNHPVKANNSVIVQNDCSIQITRGRQFQYTKPLLFIDMPQLQSYLTLKSSIQQLIEERKASGIIKSAAVNFQDLNSATWFSINEAEKFNPASIMKLMTLIYYLYESESDPRLLEQKLLFNQHFDVMPEQTIVSKTIKHGQYYTIRQLLQYMCTYSDNNATAMLNNGVNFEAYKKLLEDLRLPIPNPKQPDYPLNVNECSLFLRIFYNASFFNPNTAEFGLSLLVDGDFKNGITRYIDPNVKIANKFGERNIGTDQQLNETAIVYIDNRPYLITIMTKGTDSAKLPTVLSEISKMVYDYMKASPYNS